MWVLTTTPRPGKGAALVALNTGCHIPVKRNSAIGSCNKFIY